jgi:hypothetical protein
MKLSVIDLRALLKTRVQELTGKNAPNDPDGLLAGVSDVQAVLDEIKTFAEQWALEKEKLEREQEASE